MPRFLDQYMPPEIPGYPCVSSPRWRTTLQVTAGGNERANQEWTHPLHRYFLPEAIGRHWDVVQALMTHWRIVRGPFRTWPWRDPLDFASVDLVSPNVTPTISAADQLLGVGDGFTDSFQLTKLYELGDESYTRDIYLPRLDTLVVAVDGVEADPADYTVTRPGGVITFDTPPLNGLDITAGFLFDVEVRFESDDTFDAILRTYSIGGFADLTLIEVRPC